MTLGRKGEIATWNHLKRQGFSHIESNFRAKTGEIDIILEKDRRVHFIEVKTVSREMGENISKYNVSHGTYRPEDNVHRDKLRKVYNTIQVWIAKNQYKGDWQLDVAAVAIDPVSRKATIRIIDNVIME